MPAPSKRSPELEAEVLSRLAKGEPLAAICRSAEKFPHPTVWRDWCAADESLSIAYARARDDGFDAIAQECLDIADDCSRDTIGYGSEEQPQEKPNTEWIQRSKLRIETRLKLLAKWDPKRYGEKLELDANVKSSINVIIGGDV